MLVGIVKVFKDCVVKREAVLAVCLNFVPNYEFTHAGGRLFRQDKDPRLVK